MKTKGEKPDAAQDILKSCVGRGGVYADPSRYRYQCWTRDLVIAIMDMLIATGQSAIVRTHLENLSERQRPNGQIPILFLDRTLPFLRDKIARSWRDKKLSFMLRRFLVGELWNLTPGTRDSEILYIIGMYEYTRQTGDNSLLTRYTSHIQKALTYIEESLLNSDGLIVGCDWRDTLEKSLRNNALLSNNALLYRAYQLCGESGKAQLLKEKINSQLWTGETYLDYQGNPRFDPLGAAFAVLYDVIPPERYSSILEGFRSVDTGHGVTIQCRHNPISKEEREVIERTDGVVVWPFVVGFSILALLKMNAQEIAHEQLEKLLKLEGFREWYDPETGKGYGAKAQLWSATLFWRAVQVCQKT